MFLTRILLSLLVAISGTIFAEVNQNSSVDTILISYLRQPKFTRSGFRCFFKHTFNQQLYSQQFLPSCFAHLVDFVEYGRQLNNPESFIVSSFDIFNQRLKEAQWVNPYAFIQLLEQLQELLQTVLRNCTVKQKQAIRNCLKSCLRDRFQELKANPTQFMDSVSQEIFVIAQGNENDPSLKDLQISIIRFLETALNKLIWDFREQQATWETVKVIAQHLEQFTEREIIADAKTLNELYWSLLYRYCYFIDCAGSELTPQTYEVIKQDLMGDTLLFLTLEEQEDFIKTKKKRLKRALNDGYAKACGKMHGILTDSVVS